MKIYEISIFDGLSHLTKYVPALDMDFALFTAKDVLVAYKKTMSEELQELCEITGIEEICELENLVRLVLPERYTNKVKP